MTNIFISYAREDIDLARGLAEDLKAQGFEVWWDTELLASDDLYQAILDALTKAGAAIVIWSKNSVKSAFVRDEARYALFHGKLVAVRAPGLDIMEIPFGFQSQHTDPVEDRARIKLALAKLRVTPAPPRPAALVEMPSSAGELVEFIARCEDAGTRRLAAVRLQETVTAGLAGAASPVEASKAEPLSAEARSLSASPLYAFLQGLVLRVPEFQLSRQGQYASYGVILGLMFLTGAIFGGIVYVIREMKLPETAANGALLALPIMLASYLVGRFARKFFLSKNWGAATVLSAFWLLVNVVLAAFVSLVASNLMGSRGSFSSPSFAISVGAIVLLTALAIYRNIRAAR